MELDSVAQDVVLRSIKNAIPSTWDEKARELRALRDAGKEITIGRYLAETGLEVTDIYGSDRGWSDLCEKAGIAVAPAGAQEKSLRRGVGRLLHVDDRQRLQHYQNFLSVEQPDVAVMTELEQRLARMLAATVASEALPKTDLLQSAVDLVWAHPQVVTELSQLFDAIDGEPSHVHRPAAASIPLQIHGRYTRIEILAAVGEGDAAKTPQWREGVYDAKRVGADLLAFTLDKTRGGFSPTTRYQDYAISPDLIHWESQSTLRADSPTGRRYQDHVAMGRSIFLFARTGVDDRAFWFLGPATYVQHEGERPMAITWRLETPLSGDLFAAFAAAVA
jgi:hypothetical protein